LDLEIALSGVSANTQPCGVLSRAEDKLKRRVDVIEGIFTRAPDSRIWDFSPMRLGTGVNDPTPAISGNRAANSATTNRQHEACQRRFPSIACCYTVSGKIDLQTMKRKRSKRKAVREDRGEKARSRFPRNRQR